MGANRRNYYGECAAYIAAIGEVKEKLGEKKCKSRFICHIMRICIQGEVPLNQN